MAIMHSLYREPGRVAIDGTTCTHCGSCARVCPADVLRMDRGKVQVSDASQFGCIACGHCMMVCPQDAIAVTGRGISPQDLVALPRKEERATADALAALLLSRRSIRRFSDRPVDPEFVARVVDLATMAPMGIPPWDIGCVSVIGREEVRRIAQDVAKGYERWLAMFRPWLLAGMRPFLGRVKTEWFAGFVLPLARMVTEGLRQGRDLVFYDAPALLIFHHSPYADPMDAGIACTYAMLAAESLGLGSTMIGAAPPILQRHAALSRRLGIPDGNKASLVLILGHPDLTFRKAIRRRFARVNVIQAGPQAPGRPPPSRSGPARPAPPGG